MSYVPIEKVIDKAGNSVYKLVILASRRSLEIAEGMPRLIEADSDTKSTTIALQEIAEGKIRIAKE